MFTLLELLHWIVARIGLTETLLILFGGVVWIIYMIWTRRPNPPRGIWRWGIWIPMVYCVVGVQGGISQYQEFNELMTTAGALNEPQKELFYQQAVFGAFKLFFVGAFGTLFIWMTIKHPRKQQASTQATTESNRSASVDA